MATNLEHFDLQHVYIDVTDIFAGTHLHVAAKGENSVSSKTVKIEHLRTFANLTIFGALPQAYRTGCGMSPL